ncbi:hypothetical protein [Stenotrophomonas sp. Iso1]|uniref:hypothetical protein n=1 Tax=Stenotrophomonas sp. Iso1 TaxID=2977283 RepID=UPI0022B7C6A2|nr:hypothetical protein [Stenotrophomonas sp. Iso1]
MMLAGMAQAQQVPPAQVPVVDTAAQAEVAQDTLPPPTQADGNVTTLGEVRALKPEEDEPLDLYRFKNPVQAQSNRFSKSWSEPPTPEQVSMSGGYLMMGINYGLMAAAKGLHKLTNGRDQIQSAIARPPPELTEQQQRRAAAFCEAGDCVEEER